MPNSRLMRKDGAGRIRVGNIRNEILVLGKPNTLIDKYFAAWDDMVSHD
jgi:hypothetical protein